MSIESFIVPHDAEEAVGFRISNDTKAIGIITDVGMSTPLIIEKLKKCNLLVIEANYDEDLLTDAQRPYNLNKELEENLVIYQILMQQD